MASEESADLSRFGNLLDLQGKRVVITGATRGVGRVLTEAFADAGAILGLIARTAADLEAVKAELTTPVMCFPGDVTSPHLNGEVAAGMVDQFGGIDVWIANAGISPTVSPLQDLDAQVFRRIIDVNLVGVFLGLQSAASVMKEGGRIIVTSSVVSDRARVGLGPYAAAKSGLVGLIRTFALELGPAGITVNAVSPGWFDVGLGAHFETEPKLHREIVEHTPLGRWGTARDLIGPYLFLASEASGFMTGAFVPVDGGYVVG